MPEGTRSTGGREHDPPEAVFGGPDGLAVIRPLISSRPGLLQVGGVLAIEHDDSQGETVPALLRARRVFTDVVDHPDLAGRPRFVTATRVRMSDRDELDGRQRSQEARRVTTFDCADPVARRAGLEAAAHAARSGNLVVMPTDTVYGIGADAFNAAAVRALLAAKGRGPDMPVPVLVGSWTTIDGLALAVPPSPAADRGVLAGWAVPGGRARTVAGLGPGRHARHRHGPDAAAPGGSRPASAGRADGRVQRQPQRSAAGDHRCRSRRQLGDECTVYLDGGESPIGVASTVVDLTAPVPRVLREGAVSIDRLRDVVGDVELPD